MKFILAIATFALLQSLAVSHNVTRWKRSQPRRTSKERDASPDIVNWLFMVGSGLLAGQFYPADCATPRKKCYGPLGCFYTDRGPLRQLCRLPYDPEDVQTEFRLFVKGAPHVEHRIHYNKPKTWSKVPMNGRLVVVYHGNYESSYWSAYTAMREELLKYTDYNAVLFVDYSLSTGTGGQQDVIQAMMNVAMAAREVTYLSHLLMMNRNIKPRDIYHICFSLGCIGPRMSSDWAAQRYGFKIGRITIIEHTAAFVDHNPDSMIGPRDADFVDAIHTSAGFQNPLLMLAARLTASQPLGHVDFYVNAGRDQPHCLYEPHMFCSHFVARRMFINSIRTCHYKAFERCSSFDVFEKDEEKQCKNPDRSGRGLGVLGFHSYKYPARGIQHVKTTNLLKPYC